MAASSLTYENYSNDEIFKILKENGVICGPVTNETRSVYLKKLQNLNLEKVSEKVTKMSEEYTDDQLRSALNLFGVTVGPINSMSTRNAYIKKLEQLQKEKAKKGLPVPNEEPMDVDVFYDAE